MAVAGQDGRADFDAGVLTSRRRSLRYHLIGYLFATVALTAIGWLWLAL